MAEDTFPFALINFEILDAFCYIFRSLLILFPLISSATRVDFCELPNFCELIARAEMGFALKNVNIEMLRHTSQGLLRPQNECVMLMYLVT